MSATAEGAGGEGDGTAEDQAYFTAIEEAFVRLRGAPLLLSPADWQVARRWRREGVPLELVLRTLEVLFARRRERGAGKRRVNSLRYFAPAVEAAWEEVRALTAPGRRAVPAPLDGRRRLAALSASLPGDLPGRDGWAARLEALAAAGEAPGDTEGVESALAALDAELLAAAEEGLSPATRGEIAETAARTLAGLAARLPAGEVDAAARRLERQILRRRLGLPVLSLFSPEALAADPGDPAANRDEPAG